MTRRMMIWSIVLATMGLGPGIGHRCVANPSSYDPAIDPADFVRVIDNPYLTLRPGTIFHYASATETNEVEVTRDTKTILGVVTTVVRDRVFRAGRVTEDTFDWYAQDKQGNVWYFGEDSREYRNGKPSTGGSWKAGEKGAKPGII